MASESNDHDHQSSTGSKLPSPSAGHISSEELKSIFLEKLSKKPATGNRPSAMHMGATLNMVTPSDRFNEVYPNLLLGDRDLAMHLEKLKKNKVTHVLNASQGKKCAQVNTNSEFYGWVEISFLGIPAMDIGGFKLKDYFQEAADFIDTGLESGGRVYVHCYQGISRSTTLVIAFLMLKRGMNVAEAARTVCSKRTVLPNEGFRKQLCELNQQLYDKDN